MAPKAQPLAEYVQAASAMTEQQLGKAAEGFIAQLVVLEISGTVGPLLTPYNIMVCEKSLALRRTRLGREQAAKLELYPGYTAPECYQGRTGSAADVYFVGAVLYALLQGTPPPDERSRREAGEPLFEQWSPLRGVIQTALALDPVGRYASLPLLLDAVRNAVAKTDFETSQDALAVSKEEGAAKGPQKEEIPDAPGRVFPSAVGQKRPVRKGVRIAAILLAVVMLAGAGLGIYSGVQSIRLTEAVAARDHARIVETMDRAPWLRGRHAGQYDYSRAMLLLQEGKLDESAELFAALGDFEDSAQIGGQIEAYRRAEVKPTVLAQFETFRELGEFLDSRERAQALVEEVYVEGLELYAQANYPAALKRFEAVEEYERNAVPYKNLCAVAQQVPGMAEEEKLPVSRQIADYERQYGIDVESLLMSDELIEYLLHGTWYTDGGEEFIFDAIDCIYIFTGPTLPEHQVYYIQQSRFIGGADGQTYVTIEYISCDELILHFVQEGDTYTLYRV